MYNFLIPCIDTDSLTVSKPDGSEFSKEEINTLTKELNDQFDEMIKWEFEFYIPKMLILKAKNYKWVEEDGTVKTKGSAFKDGKSPPMFKQFKNQIAEYLLNDKESEILKLYYSYVKATKNITDIKPYAKKITITDKVLKPTRTNEQKQFDALKGRKPQMGDKMYVYFKSDQTISLVEDWDGDYDRIQLIKNLFMSLKIFSNVIKIEEYPNLTLKKNKTLLEQLDNE